MEEKAKICENEKEIIAALKRKKKEIYAYTDIVVSARTARKIHKNKVRIYGCTREK